jgi:hypothetical protein
MLKNGIVTSADVIELAPRLEKIGENSNLLFHEIASNGIEETAEKDIEVDVLDLNQLTINTADVHEGNADLSDKTYVVPDRWANNFQEFVTPYGYTFKEARGKGFPSNKDKRDQAILRTVGSIEHFSLKGDRTTSLSTSYKFHGLEKHALDGGNVIDLGTYVTNADGTTTVTPGKLTDIKMYEALQDIDETGGLGKDMVALTSNDVGKVMTFVMKNERNVIDPTRNVAKFNVFETDFGDLRRIRGGKVMANSKDIIIFPKELVKYVMQYTKLEADGVVLGEGFFFEVLMGITNTQINKMIYTKMSLQLPAAKKFAIIRNVDTNLNNYTV